MSDMQLNSPGQSATESALTSCDGSTSCCSGDEANHSPLENDVVSSHSHDDGQKLDGAGEPCPAPIMWQEICANYFQESVPWQIECGPDRIDGRVWGQGQPLYFLNNFAATAELNSLISWLLKDEFRCVLFDVSSIDQKLARRSKPAIDQFAADLFAVADHLGDEQFAIFGAGFGAAVGLEAILEQPHRVTGAILQHGFAKRRLGMFERLLASICLRSAQNLDKLPQRRRFQAVNHQPWFPPFDSSRFEFLVESTGNLPLRDLARRALAVNSFDVSNRLGEITCPVMLLRTEGEGRLAAESQTELEKEIKNRRVEWMHSAGQHPCLTHPHRVAKLVRSFFVAQPAPV